MLVLVSNREDLTSDWLVLELQRRGEPFVRLCSEDYPATMGIDVAIDHAMLEIDGDTLDARAVSAVWWRRPVPPAMAVGRDPAEAAWAAGEAQVAWEAFWRYTDAHWVNRPEANLRTDCKPLQLREAHRLGLSVPPTLVTNRMSQALAFQNLHGDIVCKALRRGVIPGGAEERILYTQRLGADALNRIGDLGPEPYLFQGFVDKAADVRVTVIGERVFACRIDSQATPESAVDWRRGSAAGLGHQPVELDAVTRGQLLQLTAAFGLRFAAIDLVVDQDGGHFFLEINPNGQWAWIEQLTGQPLSAALADELVSGRE